jgi:hypothetical protein
MAKKTKKIKPRKRTAPPPGAGQMVLRVALGAGGGALLAVALLAAASLGMKLASSSMGGASAVSLGIKVVCAAAAGMIALAGGGSRGWLRGLCAGAAALMLAGLVISLAGSAAAAPRLWLADAGLGAATGLAVAVVSGLFKGG